MSITYPLTFPTVIAPQKTKMRMMVAAAVSESPFSYGQQTFLHPGDKWGIDVTMPIMKRAKAEQFITFMAKLKGRYGTFLIGDYDGRAPRGIATGTPLVNGGSQTGESLITDGWTASKNGILLAGDYVQLGSTTTTRLYKVLDDVNSDSGGNATLLLWPRLRSSPADNDPLTLSNAMTQFRLDAMFDWDANECSAYQIQFSAGEAL